MYRSNRPLTYLALAAALAAAACSKPNAADQMTASNSAAPLPTLPATLPLATGAPTQAGYAPAAAALPSARPVRTVRVADPRDAYAYADDAYAFSNALGDAPPDYGFDYGGTEPWAWQGYDESRVFMEPVPNGYRYYYYRPDADEPYFVRDPDYGYGYDNGALAVIYAATGAVLPFADYGPRLGYASRYLVRGEDLFRASRANERRAVIAANCAARQDAIAASRDRWAAAEARQAGWQAYRAQVADQQARHWAQEAARRDADAHRFATWRGNGFDGAPPPRAIPAAWQQAPWAQDRARYRPANREAVQVQPAVAMRGGDPRQGDGRQGNFGQGNVGRGDPRQGFAAMDPSHGPERPNGSGPRDQREMAQAPNAPQHAAARPDAQPRGPDHARVADQRARNPGQPHADRGPQGGRAPMAFAANRPTAANHDVRRPAEAVHVHRGAPDGNPGGPRMSAPQSQHVDRAPMTHGDPRPAERQQAAPRQAPPAMRQAPAQHASAPAPHNAAPPSHMAAPAPHPQGGGAPHPSGGGGGDHGGHH